MKTVDIAIVGAASTVAETLLEILAERQFPLGKLHVLDEHAASGMRLEFDGKPLKVGDIAGFDFSQVQLAFFVGSEAMSQQYAEAAAAQGCVVIDRTPAFRQAEDVPLVVPEVNAEAIAGYTQRNIIAMPGCSAVQIGMALKPVHDQAGLSRINISTYQAVSGAGKQAAEELASQTAALLNFRDVKCNTFDQQIAFNVLPQIGELGDNGYSAEESKLMQELQKLFAEPHLAVNVTAVRVPVFIGHAAAVQVQTRDYLPLDDAEAAWQQQEGVELQQDSLPTPVSNAAGNDTVYIGRVREDISMENGLNLWLVTDNMRKGAATNAVQIAEILVKLYI